MTAAGEHLKDRRILVVEDEYFIAADLSSRLIDCGAEVAGPVATLEDAFELLDTDEAIDGAVVDINLRGRFSYPLADRLIEAGVPFLFLTGYDAMMIPSQYSGVTRCEKPVSVRDVVAALESGAAAGCAGGARPEETQSH